MTNEERKQFIYDEIIVDAYNDEEINMSWYYYFADNMEFPFMGYYKTKKRDGTKATIRIEIYDICSTTDEEILFEGILTQTDYFIKLGIADLQSVITTDENLEMLNHWLFWKKKPMIKEFGNR